MAKGPSYDPESYDQKIYREENSNDGFINRLKLLINEAGSAEKLARKTGVIARNISKYLSGSDPSRKRLIKLAEGAKVNLLWLATGVGPQNKEEKEEVNDELWSWGPDEPKNFFRLPPDFCKIHSFSGELAIQDEQATNCLIFNKSWLIDSIKVDPDNLIVIRSKGDAMYPTISDGDLILVDRSQRDIRDDAIYVLLIDHIPSLKRLQRLYDGSIQIKSDNKAYDTELVPRERVNGLNVIGRVVWAGGRI